MEKKKQTVHKTEPPFTPYIISLAPEIVDLVKDGQKVKTYRLGKKYDYLRVGDKVDIINTISRELAVKARIVDKYSLTFKDLPLNNLGHEPYVSKEEQRKVMNGYYAYLERDIKDDDMFLVLEFEKIN